MPESFRDYPVVEAAILVRGSVPLASGHERAQEGDIGLVRRPFAFIGRGERSRLLWLRLEGLDWNEIGILNIVNAEPLNDLDGSVYDKRRYHIPLDRLKQIARFRDLARVRDINDVYQPFMNIDEETGEVLPSPRASFSVHGLVFDKALQDFL